ncbi:MAG: translocation and assembly module protein TamB, partial [Paracoccaceae bacterium]
MRFIWAILLLLLPVAGFAQESDKDFLTRYLEENLSDAGRVVTVTGFVGALSSQATMQQMTIADDQGIWLTLKGVTLDWSRSALLSGQIDVNEFTVDEIDLERIPSTKSKMPSAEAKGFSLPNLPVSINLKDIAAKRIVLGAAVLGQKVEGTLTASALLAGGQGVANLTLVRTDAGPKGKFTFIGSYANATGQLSLALTASEDAGGVAVGLLGVPGSPSADLIIGGTGPITDFTANVSLKTDGVSRLAGKVTLTGDDKGNSFAVDLAGDPTPVFLPQYAAFFGPNVHLTAKGQRLADGSTALSQLQIRTQALSLDGSLSLNALGAPAAFNLTGQLGLADGALVLPMKGSQETRLNHADVSLTYDRSKGDGWQGKAVVAGLDQSAFTAATMTLEGSGHISRDAVGQLFDGQITFAADGLAMKDPGLAQALGTALDGQVDLKWTHGDARLSVSNLAIKGNGFRVSTTGGIAGLGDGFALKGNAQGQYDDLSRLSTLAGRPLAGLVSFDLSGDGSPLSGFFDGKGSLNGKDLSVGVSQLDGLLRGDSAISLDLRRDATGTTVRALEVTTTTLKATAQGRLTNEGNSLSADLDFSDLSVLGANYHGALKGKGSLVGSFDKGTVSLQATGTNLAVGQPQADLLLAGESTLSVNLTLADGAAVIDTAVITNPQLTLDATGRLAVAANDVTAKLTLPDLSVLGGTYRGALQGQARLTGTLDAAVVSLDGTGTDLAVGQDLVDRLLQGQSTVSITAKIENGAAVVDHAVVSTPQFSIDATGRMASAGSDVTANLTLPNLAVLGGAYSGAVQGKAHLLGDMNTATITLDGTATNLALGQPQLDGLLTGKSTLVVAVKLDKGLVAIDRAVISNPHLNIDATGTLAAAGSDVTAKLALTDLSGISAAYSGAATGEAHFTGQPTDGHLSVTASSSNLAMGQHLLDTLLRGQSTLLLDLDLTTVGVKINEVKLVTPQITAEATGTANGAERRLQLTARLGNLAVLYPQFPGALTAIGTAVQSDA